MQAHDSPGSIEHFQKAIAIYANYAEAYQLLGVAHLELERQSMLNRNCRKPSNLNPSSLRPISPWGICRNQLQSTRKPRSR